jgi:hypothetical protein
MSRVGNSIRYVSNHCRVLINRFTGEVISYQAGKSGPVTL